MDNTLYTALISIRKQLAKPFRNATKEYLRSILKWMEQRNYKPSTSEKFRQILKLFYKVVYGNGKSYPEQVKFFSTRFGKEKYTSPRYLDIREYLEEDNNGSPQSQLKSKAKKYISD